MLDEVVERQEQPVSLIVLDTLARCLAGNENEAEDMSAFIQAVDALRYHFDCAVMVIHHTSKADAKMERGSGAFRGATDTMLNVRMTDKQTRELTITNDKQRDDEDALEQKLRLLQVKMEDISSCVPVALSFDAQEHAKMCIFEKGAPWIFAELVSSKAFGSRKTLAKWLKENQLAGKIAKESGKMGRWFTCPNSENRT